MNRLRHALLSGACLAASLAAAGAEAGSSGQTIYVPAYSHIVLANGREQPLSSTLVVHNLDPEATVTLLSVQYYDLDGRLLRSFLDAPLRLPPFASRDFLVEQSGETGGTGANFLVEWQAADPVEPPLAEALMVGGTGTLGISFTSRGRVIAER